MPIIQSSGLCGPKVVAHVLGLDLTQAQALCQWQPEHGSSPEGVVRAFKKSGYHARFETCGSLERCVQFRAEHPAGVVILLYWSFYWDGPDGHYVEFLGLDAHGDLAVWDPDMPHIEHLVVPRAAFEPFWFDYRPDSFELLKRGAIFAAKA